MATNCIGINNYKLFTLFLVTTILVSTISQITQLIASDSEFNNQLEIDLGEFKNLSILALGLMRDPITS
jgi:hypothetical protein